MIIGEIIRKCRTERKITHEEMADALHVTPQAVSRWETGISYPDISMIPQISKFLNVSADRLLGCTDTEIKTTNSQQVLNQSQIDSIFDYVPGKKGDTKKILVVDDADFMQMMLRDILSTEGHQIIEAQNGNNMSTIHYLLFFRHSQTAPYRTQYRCIVGGMVPFGFLL